MHNLHAFIFAPPTEDIFELLYKKSPCCVKGTAYAGPSFTTRGWLMVDGIVETPSEIVKPLGELLLSRVIFPPRGAVLPPELSIAKHCAGQKKASLQGEKAEAEGYHRILPSAWPGTSLRRDPSNICPRRGDDTPSLPSSHGHSGRARRRLASG